MDNFYPALDSLFTSNEKGIIGTVVVGHPSCYPTGTKFLIDSQGKICWGDFNLQILNPEDLQEVFRTKQSKVIDCLWQEINMEVFLDPINPKPHLIVLGGGHIALPLVNLGKMLDFQVSVIDDRLSFANQERFWQADQVYCEDFRKAIRQLKFDNNTYVIIVTRGHRHDKTCIEEVLAQPRAAYVGMIGSRRKVAALFREVSADGFTDEQLQGIYTPIGLDIGAQTPEEISVSIMAEIIMVNRLGYSEGLKNRNGGNNGG